jgi:hypothetical protein
MVRPPYPFLCPSSMLSDEDLRDHRFDSDSFGVLEIDGTHTGVRRAFEFTIQYRNDYLTQLMIAQRAQLVLVLESKSSLARKMIDVPADLHASARGAAIVYVVDLDEQGIALPAEVSACIVLSADVHGYALPGAPSTMGVTNGINLPAGAIVGHSSVMQLLPGMPEADSPIEIRVGERMKTGDSPSLNMETGDKIIISVSKEDYAMIHALKEGSAISHLLLYAITMPALMQAIIFVQNQGKEGSDDAIEAKMWFQSLKGAIEALKAQKDVQHSSSAYMVAHCLLHKELGLSSAVHHFCLKNQKEET